MLIWLFCQLSVIHQHAVAQVCSYTPDAMVTVYPNGQADVRFIKNLQQHIVEADLAAWIFRNTDVTFKSTSGFTIALLKFHVPITCR